MLVAPGAELKPLPWIVTVEPIVPVGGSMLETQGPSGSHNPDSRGVEGRVDLLD